MYAYSYPKYLSSTEITNLTVRACADILPYLFEKKATTDGSTLLKGSLMPSPRGC